jgi:hypothetical protein
MDTLNLSGHPPVPACLVSSSRELNSGERTAPRNISFRLESVIYFSDISSGHLVPPLSLLHPATQFIISEFT